ncbi:MAG: adenosylmethionine--8-amino-7-oxononanoate transaminase [Gammaproteobacteria bacterium]|uniref:Adenosylmethionine-8-amino-7-oxononanoate aminotransferase n=1 Tax=Candidatus Thiopontia autotrophica TaxID=2841688 RepID=A0A8J6TQM4_9GAMM|nr:adenosylmethionine--8-amino-7-oxononanoate transaminase [Candidatus Thiopontia autotrophica]MBL6969588.1 adenosylmethionine--8-amino-7-oxononanoate transaminase [Gammaproteobacteria bacterium]
MANFVDDLLRIDRKHLWHPYTSMTDPLAVYPVRSARGAVLTLEDGTRLIDGMSSWWSAIHGYNVPEINAAMEQQIGEFSHVMFGGLTHRPAVGVAERLLDITPSSLNHVFLSDSGSIAVEVALKMAVQYWIADGKPEKSKMAVLRGGYHGDTFATMALADPENGMHVLFNDHLAHHFFIPRPACKFGQQWDPSTMEPLQQLLDKSHDGIAALVLEPVVQGAGGIYFYHPNFLQEARKLCDRYNVLLIADEVATGFGRTGELFGCNHANISPDILCVGKALTGGAVTLAATVTTTTVAETISSYGDGALMHGPTFMGNPLACSAANASIDLLLSSPWRQRVHGIEDGLSRGLAPCREFDSVRDLRVLGAIGVVEMVHPVDLATIEPMFVEHGVWVRPFGRLIYLMPPFIISDDELEQLTSAVVKVVASLSC